MSAQTRAAKRGRSKRGRAKAERSGAIEQLPWKLLRRPFSPQALLSADEIESIHQASLGILQEIGMDFMSEEARALLKTAGAEVSNDNPRVRFDPAMVMEIIQSAPAEFTLHARNPQRNIRIGGDYMAFGNVSSPPNACDTDNGRRPGNTRDYQNFLRLSQYFNCIHFIGGYPVEPVDRHVSIRHLECIRDMITLTDKTLYGYCTDGTRIRDSVEMARIARQIDHEQLQHEPSILSVVSSNSPLLLDDQMLNGIIELASLNQAICLTPFTLAGAMAPVTLAGALAQQNAEVLAGLVIAQVVRPGVPFLYGGFTSNVDMKSGAPALGTPEYLKSTIVGGQMARRYNLPYRSSNVCSANAVDAQAGYESMFSLWGVVMGGGNLIKHAAGWMEGGLVASYEKFILDVDLIQMVATFLEPLVVDDSTLALDAIREVGPGGHFFGTGHTLERYSNAFYAPLVSDWRNYEAWQEAGKPQAWQKANQLWKQVLAEYQEPALDPAIRDEIDAFVARRIEEGGVKTDF